MENEPTPADHSQAEPASAAAPAPATEAAGSAPTATPAPAAETAETTAPATAPATAPTTVTTTGAAAAAATPLDLDGIQRDLADVELALARLDAGTYWTDEVTGAPLPAELLAQRPTARRAPV
ncbi:MAG: hypothetical protein Q7V88_11320 [Actinomycetota bacterium]|nr:hypothetical protein [Actinomycetota bacterium]